MSKDKFDHNEGKLELKSQCIYFFDCEQRLAVLTVSKLLLFLLCFVRFQDLSTRWRLNHLTYSRELTYFFLIHVFCDHICESKKVANSASKTSV